MIMQMMQTMQSLLDHHHYNTNTQMCDDDDWNVLLAEEMCEKWLSDHERRGRRLPVGPDKVIDQYLLLCPGIVRLWAVNSGK